MIEILDCPVDVAFPVGQHPHCLVAQIPVHLERSELGYVVPDASSQWKAVRSVLDVVTGGDSGLGKTQVLLFPEGCLPLAHLDDMLTALATRFRTGTVTVFGLEHVALGTYLALLERYREDNPEALARVRQDLETGSAEGMPVNLCCVAVKEEDGRLRVFLEAKGHPFHGEESLDKGHDLYQGRHVYLFRCRPAFNFMVLVCLDYLYRDLYGSTIQQIVDHANGLYFASRQALDALLVMQCNPKPEHPAYQEILRGFYGEYLEDTPGVRDTVTVFGNCSSESRIEGQPTDATFGHSSAVIGSRHHRDGSESSEYRTDDCGGGPLHRLRFGADTRLFSFNLPLHRELDPRSTRIPLKVHGVLHPDGDGGWLRVAAEELRRRPVLDRGAAGPCVDAISPRRLVLDRGRRPAACGAPFRSARSS
jgi:hypothetical protein